MKYLFSPLWVVFLLLGCQTKTVQVEQVGPSPTGGHIVSTYQALASRG